MLILIKAFVKLVSDGLYKVLKLLNLQYTFLVLVVAFVLYVTGVLVEGTTLYLAFQILLVTSIVFSVLVSVYKMIKPKNKPKEQEEKPQVIDAEKVKEKPMKQKKQKEVAKYYRVSQNPRYVMAEYSDRVVLYYQKDNKLKLIRTDYYRTDAQIDLSKN